MGIVSKRYGDACGTARKIARDHLTLYAARDSVEGAVEAYIAALHAMPPWALRAIADKVDPTLPET